MSIVLFPSCGEAAAVYSPVAMGGPPPQVDPETGELFPTNWELLDQAERDARNSRRAANRSSGRMRRFMVHNRLTKMWVLTFAHGLTGETGYRAAQSHARSFVRRLRRNFFGDRPVPYLWSIEPHPEGHGWHINFMLPNVFIDKHQMQRCWGHGNVWYTDFTKDTADWLGRSLGRRGAGSQERSLRSGARRAASYAAKYIGKDLHQADDIPPRAHRYEVAEGFQPSPVVMRVRTFAEAHRWIADHPSFGSLVWHGRSEDWDGFDGPPCEVVMFDPPRGVKGRRRRSRVTPEGRP